MGNRSDRQPTGPPLGGRRGFFLRCLVGICWLYPFVMGSLCILLRWADLWWPATFLMFSPRLLFALPVVVLAPAVVLVRRARLLLPLGIAAMLAAGPLSGGNVPSHVAWHTPAAGLRLRILTCNMHYRPLDSAPLDDLVRQTDPHVVALQEWVEENHSPLLTGPGWHTHRMPGLFLASRTPIGRVARLGDHPGHEQGSVGHYELETPGGVIHLFSLHLDSPRQAIYETVHKGEQGTTKVEGNMGMRWRQSRYIAAKAAGVRGPVVLVGDFNTPPESAIFREVWHDYRDAFGEAGWGWGYTFHGGRTRVRIDHILGGDGWHCERCWVGPSVGSPHFPVLADMIWEEP